MAAASTPPLLFAKTCFWFALPTTVQTDTHSSQFAASLIYFASGPGLVRCSKERRVSGFPLLRALALVGTPCLSYSWMVPLGT